MKGPSEYTPAAWDTLAHPQLLLPVTRKVEVPQGDAEETIWALELLEGVPEGDGVVPVLFQKVHSAAPHHDYARMG